MGLYLEAVELIFLVIGLKLLRLCSRWTEWNGCPDVVVNVEEELDGITGKVFFKRVGDFFWVRGPVLAF